MYTLSVFISLMHVSYTLHMRFRNLWKILYVYSPWKLLMCASDCLCNHFLDKTLSLFQITLALLKFVPLFTFSIERSLCHFYKVFVWKHIRLCTGNTAHSWHHVNIFINPSTWFRRSTLQKSWFFLQNKSRHVCGHYVAKYHVPSLFRNS